MFGIRFATINFKVLIWIKLLFWVGEDIKISTYFVKSINNIYPDNDVKITHLTDIKTSNIEGVTNTIRSDLSKD